MFPVNFYEEAKYDFANHIWGSTEMQNAWYIK